jgi:FtsP/CotA-like multicopper oxidase with cupredoxin domain
MNMTNLHFHGLAVSPQRGQDDVLGMMAKPGETLHYSLHIPLEQAPGLFWYHTHPHGESMRQDLDGMSGAIVVEGIDRYAPEVRGLRERIFVLRERSVDPHGDEVASLKRALSIPKAACGSSEHDLERVFTLNDSLAPSIDIAPGEQQFWRIVNAAPDRYADLTLGGQPFKVVALDGMPFGLTSEARTFIEEDHVLLPPGGRVEAIVTGPPASANIALRTRCIDTGADGDWNPEMILARITPERRSIASIHEIPIAKQPPLRKIVDVTAFEKTPPDFTVNFTEDKSGFYINGEKYQPDAKPMTEARVGTYQHWRIVNNTQEIHPMHIHQVHFLAYAVNGRPIPLPLWLDTVNVPVRGSVDVIMDFTDPVIRGMSVFHCHLLNHEDKGMMAKIFFK